ncbi:hypothetical protein MTTB_p120 (plasmid) [Methanothermobacter tenebrarum]|uniref:Uncharacterized protein n=1 Tax=Methanothermobacter tenebrarum TaxID=680118 RepID=A0ABM7YFY6_9EURY|nr:hypothetical protein MTTB_p120 [Methanothermobacter tenebrarum]
MISRAGAKAKARDFLRFHLSYVTGILAWNTKCYIRFLRLAYNSTPRIHTVCGMML